MRCLGIDYGEKRIGLSYGDELGVAVPLTAAVQATLKERLAAIGAEIAKRRIDRLVVGYPYNMDGSVGRTAEAVDTFIGQLEQRFGLPVERVDERLTSHQAETSVPKGKRKSIQQTQAERRSGELDSRAAAIILQDYLNQQIPAAPWMPDEFPND